MKKTEKANAYASKITKNDTYHRYLKDAFIAGANWQKEQKDWHDLSADKNDLPNKDCVVIVAIPFPEDSNLSNMEEYAITDYDSNTKKFECDYFELNEDRDFKWKYIE